MDKLLGPLEQQVKTEWGKGSPEAKNDLQKLQGTWLCRWREYDGKKHPGEDETWTFDGKTWTQVQTSVSPGPRSAALMISGRSARSRAISVAFLCTTTMRSGGSGGDRHSRMWAA